jgi:polyhydroxyalkanoate synthesis repressor PhaR
MAKHRVIKKYPNRRLYDTDISSYITVEDVRQLVLDGEDFEVRDAKSGEDITRTVLLQIISEHEERGQPMFSARMLSQIIRFYGDSLQGFMGGYLERSLQNFLDQSQQFRGQMSGLIGQNPWQMVNDLTERNLEIWKSMQTQIMNSSTAASTDAGAPRQPKK